MRYSPSRASNPPHRLGHEPLAPHPRHQKHDGDDAEAFPAIAPALNIGTMIVVLEMRSRDMRETGDGNDVGREIMHDAGWHVSKRPKTPRNIVIRTLPPYSPELNPVENLWHRIGVHRTGSRAYGGDD